MKEDDETRERRIRMYPDTRLREQKREFRNTMLETVRELFPKLPGR
jgi:hypothetical protein